MSNTKKIIQAAAGSAGGAGLNVEEVFSTYLYEGAGSTQTITNGIDLAGEGGLVWMKNRDAATNHRLYTTDLYSGSNSNLLQTNLTTGGGNTGSFELESFNSDGFTLGYSGGAYSESNGANTDYASWTFRKAPKFFDVVTWTGDGNSGRQISHNLGSAPAVIIIKSVNFANNWLYNTNFGASSYDLLYLDLTNAASSQNYTTGAIQSAPTDSTFTLKNSSSVNGSGNTYVAYLFAHNDGDGDFGPDGDADIIKCGSYTGNGSTDGPEIDLGFEPQWVLIKSAVGGTSNWGLFDNMRGLVADGTDSYLLPDLSNAELNSQLITPTSTGFKLNTTSSGFNGSGRTIIYIAIRRGPMAVPTDATDVFYVDTVAASSSSSTGFDPDMWIRGSRDGSGGTNSQLNMARLIDGKYLATTQTSGEIGTNAPFGDGPSNQFTNTVQGGSGVNWFWKRAPNYFDVVAYTGNGTAGRTVSHNLGVAPEMMWIKNRDGARNWAVYHKDLGGTKLLYLNGTNTAITESNIFNNTDPTESVFTLGSNRDVNSSISENHIAYLFASLDGVSKVGSYTGNGTSQNIDCGFSSGARFVLIKSSTQATEWFLFDSERGIVSGNDPALLLDTTDAEYTSYDLVDPYSSGFAVNYVGAFNGTNTSGQTYIFYAIA